MAIEAGCDGVLICSGDHATQVAALEALIHAVEQERIPYSRVEDAHRSASGARRNASSASPVAAAKPATGRALRQMLGRDEHRAIADEMARFL